MSVRGQRHENQVGFGAGVTRIVEKENAAVRLPIAMDQGADVVVLRHKYPPFAGSFGKQSRVAWVSRSFACIGNVVTGGSHRAHSLRDDVGIGEEAHAIRRRW